MTLRRPALPRAFLAAVTAGACLGLTSCTGTGSGTDAGGSGAQAVAATPVDVDTPALRAAKKRAGIGPCPATDGRGAATDGLPDVTLACLGGGRPVTLGGLRGPLVVNLFAQWCGPCRGELPFYQALHAKARGTVRVLGVDYLDTQPGAALAMVQHAGGSYPLVADPAGRLRGALHVRGLPGIVLVDRAGRVVDVEYRAFRSYAELRALVQQQLHVRLPA